MENSLRKVPPPPAPQKIVPILSAYTHHTSIHKNIYTQKNQHICTWNCTLENTSESNDLERNVGEVELGEFIFYQKYLECFIMSFHTCVIFFYLSSLTSDRNNLLMSLPYFYLDSGQNFGCSILLIKKEAAILKYYPKTL